jgi:tRNA (guanine37-N1)-methyltransferase
LHDDRSGGETDRDRAAGRVVGFERVTFDIVTIFPAMIEEPLRAGILGRAIDRGTIDVKVRDLRDFTTDRHRVVDDVPYGGGPGMVLKPDPIFRALDAIEAERGTPLTVILTSPQGTRFTQAVAQRLSAAAHLVLLCGRYEGFDDRVRERVTEELSIGDYVVSGGELPALVVLDAVARLVPGVVGDGQSVTEDSFNRGLLDFPQFTRPPEVAYHPEDRSANATDRSATPTDRSAKALAERSLKVPDVLLSGNHAAIRRWRKRAALARTLERRPDLLAGADLDDEEKELLKELRHGRD